MEVDASRGGGEAAGGSTKRKRGGAGGDDAAGGSDGANPVEGSASVVVDEDELLHPNFEELARQYPSFDAVYRRHQHLLSAPSAIPHHDDDESERAVGARRKQGGDHNGAGAKNSKGGSKLQQAMAFPDFRLELTRALLRRHWNVRIPSFDSDIYLCPPVPNRYYFVKWLRREVLTSTAHTTNDNPRRFHSATSNEPQPPLLRGLDIGTGAAAIYALLWAATNNSQVDPPIEMYGTDVDTRAVEQAQHNLLANQAMLWAEHRSRVHVVAVPMSDRQRSPSQPLLQRHDSAMEVEGGPTHSSVVEDSTDSPTMVPRGPLRVSLEALADFHRTQGIDEGDVQALSKPLGRIDFCLTNPPFFDVHEDRGDRADGHDRTVMTHNEGCYPGGEFAFLVDMIADGLYLHHVAQSDDSEQLTDQSSSPLGSGPPRWMACMCGKKTTFTKIRGILRYILGRSRVLSTEFGPGFMTRWFVAWTMNERPIVHSPLAASATFSFRVPVPLASVRHPPTNPLDEVEDRVREYCESFPGVNFQVDSSRTTQTSGSNEATAHLQMTLRPERPELCADQDDTLPKPIRTVVSMMSMEQRLEWLPTEGHFSLELSVTLTSSSLPTPELVVAVESFAHNSLGRTIVERVQLQLEGEINRTNRRWRRILQRQQQQRQQQPEGVAMDET